MAVVLRSQSNVAPRPPVTDRFFNWLLAGSGATVLLLVFLLAWTLAKGANPALKQYGWRFLIDTTWDPVREHFGGLPFVYGTVVSSILALALAVPVGLGAAIFLAEVAPRWIARPLSFMVELVAAVPSVVLGMWGIFVLVPFVRALQEPISERWGDFFLFSGPPLGIGMMAAGIILAIMILPFVASISREALEAVPRAQAEAALALGATHWETIRGPLLRYARKGIIGGVVLALGRALGETMAVTMVIGNTPIISPSLFESGYTMSAVLANEFAEATGKLHEAALVEIALLLLGVTLAVNALARLMMMGLVSATGGGES